MPKQAPDAHKVTTKYGPSRKKKQAHRSQLLVRGVPSVTRSIAGAICIKDGNIFFVADADGNVPLEGGHGFGLYYHDCRYLNGYQFQIADGKPIVLAAATGTIGTATFELTNPHLELGNGVQLPSGEIGIAWERKLDPAGIRLQDTISIKNYSRGSIEFPVTFSFASEFEDVFTVRGLLSDRPGKLQRPEWDDGKLVFSYEGADGYNRRLTVELSPKPDVRRGRAARYGVSLDRLESTDIHISLTISEELDKDRPHPRPAFVAGRSSADPKQVMPAESSDWFDGWPAIQSDSLLLNQVVERATRDLQSLWSSIRGEGFIAAGIPWFTTLFGRDSLITAMQMLPIKPEIAAQTLRLLSTYQAHEEDARRDAQPGKILHELRVGELAAIGSIPHSPYYGSVDATPLFLILMDEYVRWTGDLALFSELRTPMELALQWIDRYGDSDGDGYVDYKATSTLGQVNQGWKDSLDAIMNADGSFAKPPIALVEVQGYVYRAKRGLARLYERSGDADQAAQMRKSAETLQAKFNRDFWNEQLGIYVLALQEHGRPAAVVASNAGQALWSGIADAELARRTVQRLMSRDMFSGWGIRTLAQTEKSYNPIGYHVGSIWPHDNAIIADGFQRYGFHEEAMRVLMGVINAAMNFEEFELPELYSGFSREQYDVPVHYPAACHPQAWAAGSVPYMLCSLLGLHPHALDHTLEIRHPMLPDSLSYLDIAGLRVGPHSVNIRFGRSSDGHTVVQAVQSDPALKISIQ